MTITITELKKVRADCDKIGLPADFITAAYDEITIDLNYMWYKPAAVERGVDFTTTPFLLASVLPASQLNNLACYKTLFFFYRAIAPNTHEPDNPFVIQRDYFDKAYETELQRIISMGLSYDWDGDGIVDSEEIPEKKRVSYYDFNWRAVRV